MMDRMQETGYTARGVFLAPFLDAGGTPLIHVVDSFGRRIKEEKLDGAVGGAASFAQVETLWRFLNSHDPRDSRAAMLFPMPSKPADC